MSPLFLPRRTFQRTSYRPGELCQFHVWQPSERIRVGHGENRIGYGVVACLGYSRAGAGCLVFSKEAPDLLFGIARCLWSLGGLAETLVWDREGALHARAGRPTEEFAALCGQLRVGWRFCEPADPQAKGAVERLQGSWRRASSAADGSRYPPDFQLQLDDWFERRANQRTLRGSKSGSSSRTAGHYFGLPPR